MRAAAEVGGRVTRGGGCGGRAAAAPWIPQLGTQEARNREGPRESKAKGRDHEVWLLCTPVKPHSINQIYRGRARQRNLQRDLRN